jgi:hypothetical protein
MQNGTVRAEVIQVFPKLMHKEATKYPSRDKGMELYWFFFNTFASFQESAQQP